MAHVQLNLGSNTDREAMLTAGLDALASQFGELALSSVYESDAVGFDGEPFYNMGVTLRTTLSPGELAGTLRQLEYRYGRSPDSQRFSPRTLDIDILTYDDKVGVIEGVALPREEILENAFVLCPLAELAPRVLHPVVGQSYSALWRGYDQAAQALTKVTFEWRGRSV